jgi:hypothetical protein
MALEEVRIPRVSNGDVIIVGPGKKRKYLFLEILFFLSDFRIEVSKHLIICDR